MATGTRTWWPRTAAYSGAPAMRRRVTWTGPPVGSARRSAAVRAVGSPHGSWSPRGRRWPGSNWRTPSRPDYRRLPRHGPGRQDPRPWPPVQTMTVPAVSKLGRRRRLAAAKRAPSHGVMSGRISVLTCVFKRRAFSWSFRSRASNHCYAVLGVQCYDT
jgi:hypothetical protein